MGKALAVGVIVAAMLFAGCGSDSNGDGDDSAPSRQPSDSHETPTQTSGECTPGTFRVTRIEGKEALGTPVGAGNVSATGGNLMLELTNDMWTLHGDNSQLDGQVGPVDVEIRVNGRATGNYVREGTAYVFSRDDSSGDVTLSALGQSQEIPMEDAARALAPGGTGALSCTTSTGTLDSETVRLSFER